VHHILPQTVERELRPTAQLGCAKMVSSLDLRLLSLLELSGGSAGTPSASTPGARVLKEEGSEMKVRDVMVKNVKFCSPETNLAAVAEKLWKDGCGTLPVVENGRVLGIITDRDICIALGTRNQKAAEVSVKDVSLAKLFCCTPGDDIHAALQTMRAQKVRRLPVIDDNGMLQGILCLDDVVLFAEEKSAELTYFDVVETMKSICEHGELLKTLAVAQ
jgi:CBS domain-containing protein